MLIDEAKKFILKTKLFEKVLWKANVATAHKMAKIFYTMVKTKTSYNASKVGLGERELVERKIAKLECLLMKLKNLS